jgi:hypothetical protein
MVPRAVITKTQLCCSLAARLQRINVRESLLSCSPHICLARQGITTSCSGGRKKLQNPSLYWRQAEETLCRRCGAEIAVANLMDADPGIDRQHFSIVLQDGRRNRLSSVEWLVFTALYQRHGRIVPLAELETATQNVESKLRGIIPRLRRSLVRSRFSVLTLHAHGYELIVRPGE